MDKKKLFDKVNCFVYVEFGRPSLSADLNRSQVQMTLGIPATVLMAVTCNGEEVPCMREEVDVLPLFWWVFSMSSSRRSPQGV